MANLEKLLRQRLAVAFATTAGEPVDPVLRRSQHADFQADGALALARRLGGDPRSIAAKVRHETDLDDLCDGGFGYAATDLAAIRYRTRDLRATRLLYVVGLPQRRHFEMVYEVARAAGWLRPPVRAEHIGFGSVLGSDGRMLRSRSGDSVKLIDLLDQAVARASAIVVHKNPELDEPTRDQVARVGIGAVTYADLSTDRVKDYVFDLDRMLSFDGNTAAYLQFAHARICSIFRRAGVQPAALDNVSVHDPAERALALELLMFGAVLDQVAESLEFHRLANYLHGVSVAFTAFYERCPVLRAEDTVRDSRLVLCDVTARTLALGLNLLGIEAPQRM